MPPNETDEELIVSYKNGSQEALKDLINRYTAPLYNFAARLANRNDASDVVQEVFIKVWKNIHRFDSGKASFKTWVFTIAKNTITDFLRKRKSLLFSDIEKEDGTEGSGDYFSENIPDENLLPDAVLQKLDDKKILNQAVNSLGLRYREVLVLHYQESMTFEEIGKILGKPLNTVKSQHRRAVIALRKNLE